MNEHSNLSNIIAFWVFLPIVVMTRVGIGIPCIAFGLLWRRVGQWRTQRLASKKAARLD